MSELVHWLAQGTHPLVIGGREPSVADLQDRIENLNFVLLRFTDTRGGTELGVRLDPSATQLGVADFASARGIVHVEGTLVLDYIPVRCIADIDLKTLAGMGQLVITEPAAQPS